MKAATRLVEAHHTAAPWSSLLTSISVDWVPAQYARLPGPARRRYRSSVEQLAARHHHRPSSSDH